MTPFFICMDRISRHGLGVEKVQFAGLRMVVVLASSGQDLQLSLDRWHLLENKVRVRVGMRMCTSKPQTMVLSQERVEVPLQVGDEILDQGEEYQSTRLTDGWSSVKKRELSREAKPRGEAFGTLPW